MSASTGIKVVARFRPQNRVELESGGQPIVKFEGDDSVTIDVCCSSLLSPRHLLASLADGHAENGC